jgi:hypothetical protein
MAQNNQKEKDYINNLFVKRVWKDPKDPSKELFSVGVKVKELVAELQKLSTNEQGFANLTMGTRKNDKDKMSVWIDDYKSDNKQRSSSNSQSHPNSSNSQSSNTPPPATKQVDDDDLPF